MKIVWSRIVWSVNQVNHTCFNHINLVAVITPNGPSLIGSHSLCKHDLCIGVYFIGMGQRYSLSSLLPSRSYSASLNNRFRTHGGSIVTAFLRLG